MSTAMPMPVPGSKDFLEELHDDGQISEQQTAILRAAHARTPEEVWSLVESFPQLAVQQAFNFPRLTTYLAAKSSSAYLQARAVLQQQPLRPSFATGAQPPASSTLQPGFTVPLPPPSASPPPVAAPPSGSINHDIPNWPVRDQFYRGTCVSFASTACCEHLSAGQLDLSEQFLYWAIKTKTADPWQVTDGSLLEFARDALQSDGISTEGLWGYHPHFIPGNVSQQSATDPSTNAIADAAGRKFSHVAYQNSFGGSAVQAVLSALAQGPVAVSVPVFKDAVTPQSNNWSTTQAMLYGHVFDPIATSILDGGHAVCIVGFEPDPAEATGGWFIFRNSWGTANFGAQLPYVSTPGGPQLYYAYRPGYGQISATYIDQYLWELVQF